VIFDGQRFCAADVPNGLQHFPNFDQRHFELARCYGGELVEYLDADGSGLGEESLDSVRFLRIGREKVEENVGIEK